MLVKISKLNSNWRTFYFLPVINREFFMLATKRLIVIILSVCSFTVFSGIEKEDFQFDFAPIVEPLSENFEPLASDLTREQLDKIVHEVVEYEQEVHSWIYEISLNIELLRDVKNKLNNLNKGEEIEYIKLCKSYLNIGDFNKAYSVLSSYLSNQNTKDEAHRD